MQEVFMIEEKIVSRAGKYLTFNLGAEEYGFEILRVLEIIGLMKITAVPRTPDYVRGIINLRGTIHPVIDLRTKFGMNRIKDTEETCIIVLEIEKNGQSEQIGVVVDNVKEVQDISEKEIENSPSLGQGVDTKFIIGMANIKNKVVKIKLERDKNGEILLQICNNGPAIDTEIEKQIFEPFFSTRIDMEGMSLGLGLAIVKDILNKINGKIIVKQSSDGWICFKIRFKKKD